MRWPTAWNVPIARSNCLRVVVYSAVMRSASWQRTGGDRADAGHRAVEDPAQVLAAVGDLTDARRVAHLDAVELHHELRLVVHRLLALERDPVRLRPHEEEPDFLADPRRHEDARPRCAPAGRSPSRR